ncbi:hypothetical protein Tco_0055752 [Tanacetum coccineum]
MAKHIPNKAQEQNPSKPKDENNVKIKFSKELLNELHNNTFSERSEEDVIGHIGKVLEILDLVKITDVDPFQIRMKALPLSLSKWANEWWMNEGNGNISVKKFFKKFYPLSCASNYDKMCDDDEEGHDLLEFIPWRNSKLKDHKKVDKMTKRTLLYTWIEIRKEEGLLNDEVSSDEEWEAHEYGNPPKDSFPKPYFKMDRNDHNENNRNAYKLSGMNLSGAPQSEDINNEQPNEGLCRVDKFEVVKYIIGDNKEFLAICTRECDSYQWFIRDDLWHLKED